MNKLMPILLGGVILFGAAACDDAKTSDEASSHHQMGCLFSLRPTKRSKGRKLFH